MLLTIFTRPNGRNCFQRHQVSKKPTNSKARFVPHKGVNFFVARSGSRNMQTSKDVAIRYLSVVEIDFNRVRADSNR
jgi:hypothetical protein